MSWRRGDIHPKELSKNIQEAEGYIIVHEKHNALHESSSLSALLRNWNKICVSLSQKKRTRISRSKDLPTAASKQFLETHISVFGRKGSRAAWRSQAFLFAATNRSMKTAQMMTGRTRINTKTIVYLFLIFPDEQCVNSISSWNDEDSLWWFKKIMFSFCIRSIKII